MAALDRGEMAYTIGMAIWPEPIELMPDQMEECLRIADAVIAMHHQTDDGAAAPGQVSGGSLPAAASPAAPSSPLTDDGAGSPPAEQASANANPAPSSPPRRFQLVRHVDVSGVSGTGLVAEGIQWRDGSVSLRWYGDHPSTVAWPSVEDILAVHGHNGATELVWLDDEPIDLWPTEGGPA